ncbi:MAG: DUF1223 domain-containing protein [Acidobacteria bacterium]|nr:MAG: DUF1223 domain-containing protein [Acidobacteriota bacterium]PYR77896.1 MAG: DUF1223 domain-containing protein [Acidobacteriota bacterium]
MTRIWLLAIVCVAAAPLLRGDDTARTPVLVELFTSEGCSSCPPADDLLSRLARTQPVAGAQVIPLGLHVDYWDALGWKDPLSSGDATRRQQNYAASLGNADVYTPQMVVDGRDAFVGSDERLARDAIQRAAARPHARLAVRAVPDGSAISIALDVTALPPDAAKEGVDAFAAIVEDGITTIVKRGENGGRTLHHDAGVRRLLTLSRKNDAAFAASAIRLADGWTPSRLAVVAFLAGRKTRHIWGVASTPLAAR